MLLLGKERGADLGVRMTGVAAAVIGVVALLIFSKYRDANGSGSRPRHVMGDRPGSLHQPDQGLHRQIRQDHPGGAVKPEAEK